MTARGREPGAQGSGPKPSLLSYSLWGLLITAGVFICLATVLGFLGRFSWFFDLFSHFRIQYLLSLLILGVLLLIPRRRKISIAFLGFSCLNIVPILPLYFGKQPLPENAAPQIRMMLVNVNMRLGNPDRVKKVVFAADPDILVLEEISRQWISELAPLTNSYPHSISEPRDDNFGIGVFSKFPLLERKICTIGPAGVPSIITVAQTGEGPLRVVATHPPPPFGRKYSSWRNVQLDQLPEYTRSSEPLLLIGDLNITPWNHYFQRLLATTGLNDSARGYGAQPSWPTFNALMRIPLDHCLHSADIVILDRRIGEDVSSDHYPLIVDFTIKK